MGKLFFDFDSGDFCHSISDNMAIDSSVDLAAVAALLDSLRHG